jgi:hypothetical protein
MAGDYDAPRVDPEPPGVRRIPHECEHRFRILKIASEAERTWAAP